MSKLKLTRTAVEKVPLTVKGQEVYPVRCIEEVQDASGVMFTPHDLGRTFITSVEGLNLPVYVVKRLVNSKTTNVTASYILTNVEPLGRPVKQIAVFLLSAAGVKPNAQVISMEAVKTEQQLMAVNE